jgi:hypothetical protein
MQRKKRAVVEEQYRPKRSLAAGLWLLLAAGLSLIGAGCNTMQSASAASPTGSSGVSSAHIPVPVLPSKDDCPGCVFIQLSPRNVSVVRGGTVQFVAAISNTSQTAVNWSSSAGSISSAGLLTVPGDSSVTSITVTASSAALSSLQASTGVTVTNSGSGSGSGNSTAFAITTLSIPPAVESSPYSAPLLATGGVPPYQWKIASGSLPAGLQLSAGSGALSGAATQAGTFNFVVNSTDSASHTAQQNLSLSVSTSNGNGNCGPPAYGCSRSDLNIAQLPSTPPSVGNLVGANTIVTDPDFNNHIVRITDAHTNPYSTFVNRTYVSSGSGSADINVWNLDSTLFAVQDTGENTLPYTFNPATMQASRMYVSSFPSTNGMMITSSGEWSRVNPNLFFTFGGTTIRTYDFTDRNIAPLPQLFYDFTTSANCLPAGFTVVWSTEGGVSGNDTVFGMAYSNTGIQGTGVYVVAYKVGSGCSILNTQTGQVGGDWGTKGTINIPDRWTIHNVKLSKDGNWMVIARTTCLSSVCNDDPYFWQIGTTTVNNCGDAGQCGGHWTEGYSHWVNNDNSPIANQVIRLYSPATSAGNLFSAFPAGIAAPLDQHQSWNNVDPDDTLPLLSSTWSSTTPFPAPWYNEIIAVAADGGGKISRFAHTFITTKSQRFSTEYAIGSVSQDGKFFLFSSDWMGKLGSESGASSCTIGTNCRGDVFVVQLQ